MDEQTTDLSTQSAGQTTDLSTQSPGSMDDITSLVTASENKFASKKALSNSLKDSGGFLPYIGISQGTSACVTDGDIGVGTFILTKGKGKHEDLGKQIVVVFIAYRSKAMDFNEPLSVYDSDSEMFKDIQQRSEGRNSGCGYGLEFLCWLPSHEIFCAYFFSGKTARNELPEIIGEMGNPPKPATLQRSINKIVGKKHTWFGGNTNPHSGSVTLPTMDKLKPVLEKFNNPSETENEVADKDDDDDR